jgi:hypothetical protein
VNGHNSLADACNIRPTQRHEARSQKGAVPMRPAQLEFQFRAEQLLGLKVKRVGACGAGQGAMPTVLPGVIPVMARTSSQANAAGKRMPR